jgi:hypothetical protein
MKKAAVKNSQKDRTYDASDSVFFQGKPLKSSQFQGEGKNNEVGETDSMSF